MEATTVRALQLYERILCTMSMGLSLRLRWLPLPPDAPAASEAVKQAWRACAATHPYICLGISAPPSADPPEKHFVTLADGGVAVEVHPAPIELSLAKERLMAAMHSGRGGDSGSVVYMQLWQGPSEKAEGDGATHELLVVLNHAAADGPGLFNIFHEFLQQLAAVIGGQGGGGASSLEQPAALDRFYDITSRMPKQTDPGVEAPPPLRDGGSNIVQAPAACPDTSIDMDSLEAGQIRAVFDELTRVETSSLLRNCRDRGVTVQGAVSTAGAVAVLAVRKLAQALGSSSLLVRNMVPCNMRAYVQPPIDKTAAVCGSAAIQWLQDISGSATLWSLAIEATKSIRAEVDRCAGFEMWRGLPSGNYLPPYTLMTSSMGVNPIRAEYEAGGDSKLEVVDVTMCGGAYKVLPQQAGTMNHIHTFDGRLHAAFEYTWPQMSDGFGGVFAQLQMRLLRLFAEGVAADQDVLGVVAELEQLV